jgi:hypothetical protein
MIMIVSILAHGLSAAPLARRYGEWAAHLSPRRVSVACLQTSPLGGARQAVNPGRTASRLGVYQASTPEHNRG